MKKIFYSIDVCSTIEIEVSNAVAEFLEQEAKEEKRAKWREKKRNVVSIDYLEEQNIQIASPCSDPLETLIMREEAKDFTWNLPLPEKYKQIVILRYRHGMTIRQIAEIVGRSKSTVSDYIQKSLRILRGGGQNEVARSLYSGGSFDSDIFGTEE